jgi:uncharacterized protein (DUF4415 family)
VGEEPRKLIAIRLDPKVLGWLRETAKKKGLPYQSLVNQILAEEMKKQARPGIDTVLSSRSCSMRSANS